MKTLSLTSTARALRRGRISRLTLRILSFAMWAPLVYAASRMQVPPLQTEFVYEALVTIDAPVDVGVTPRGRQRYIPITGGTFEGPRIRGVILPGGADWQTDRADGTSEVSALYSMRCDDGTVVVVHNNGVITDGGAYMRTAPRFDVPDGVHAWLSKAQFIGSIAGGPTPGSVIIRVFRVL
jgi:hypothetical protein